MNIIDNRTASNRAQWQGATNKHQYIAMHYLGVPNADNPNLYNGGFGGHFYISRDGKVYQSADVDQVIWHVGASAGYKERYPNGWKVTNWNCIGIEMGVYKDSTATTNPSDGDWYYSTAEQEAAVELVKYLMEKYSIPADHVLRHGDITTKHCPAPWLNPPYKTNWTWEEFKRRISGGTTTSKPTATTQSKKGSNFMFSVSQIKLGDAGVDVLLAQEILKARGIYKGNLDRSFGGQTQAAVKAYQTAINANGSGVKLSVDGIIGPSTWSSLLGKEESK